MAPGWTNRPATFISSRPKRGRSWRSMSPSRRAYSGLSAGMRARSTMARGATGNTRNKRVFSVKREVRLRKTGQGPRSNRPAGADKVGPDGEDDSRPRLAPRQECVYLGLNEDRLDQGEEITPGRRGDRVHSPAKKLGK